MKKLKKNAKHDVEPIWFKCEVCEDWYCSIHDKHVAECDCPSVEEWSFDPRTGEPY